jgi:hypothetical protein
VLGLLRIIAWLAPFSVAGSVALLAAQLGNNSAETAGWLLVVASATFSGLSVMRS